MSCIVSDLRSSVLNCLLDGKQTMRTWKEEICIALKAHFQKKAQIKLVIIGTFLMVVNSYNGSFLIVYLWRASFSCVSQLPCYLWIIWQEHPPLSKT